jgi:hypothetical protein
MIVIPFFMWKIKSSVGSVPPLAIRPFFLPGNLLVLYLPAFCNILKHATCFCSDVMLAPRSTPMVVEHPSLPSIFANEDPLCHAYKGSGNISSNLVDKHGSFRVIILEWSLGF